VFAAIRELAGRWPESEWLRETCERALSSAKNRTHGDLPRWSATLEALPAVPAAADLDQPEPRLGADAPDRETLTRLLMKLHPWRKGPLRLGGVHIDTEWRSDWKWARIGPHLDLQDARVLDIGSGNGYFGLRMLGQGAKLVVGIDPTLLFVIQWLACRHFSGPVPNYVLPLGVEALPAGPAGFDCISSMGVLYHRRDPLHHLRRLRALMHREGTLVLETLVLPEDRADEVLVPEARYARMRNVWAIPGTGRLLDWLEQAGFVGAAVVRVDRTTTSEQRSTGWMRFESLENALDPENRNRTVEGHPAPARAVVIARAGAAGVW